MEIVIVVAIWSVMVKRGVEDLIHAARGNTPKRYEAASTRRSNGAAGRYWGALWDDTFEDLLTRHNTKRARRAERSSTPTEHPDTARSVLRDFGTDFGHWARGTWAWGWEKAARRREERLLRPSKRTVSDRWRHGMLRFRQARWRAHNRFKRAAAPLVDRWDRAHPGQDVVPGTVVPNAQDGDRPQDGDGPDLEPVPDEDEDEDGDDIEDEPSQQDEDGDEKPPPCSKCGTAMTTAPNIGDLISYDGDGIYRCPRCDYKIRRETTDDSTQEGTTIMTATTTEVVGLDSAIRFCEDSARAYKAQIQAIEQTQAALAAGDVSGPAAESFSQAMEQSSSAATAMEAAAAELLRHKQVQEAYLANQGAGTRDFILAGQ